MFHGFRLLNFLLKSLQKSLSRFLITRFSEECKHIFLVALHTRLIERIYSQKISADSHRKFKEIKQLSELKLILLRNLHHKVRHIAVRVREDRSVHRTLVDKIHIFACEVVEPVKIYRLLIQHDRLARTLHI